MSIAMTFKNISPQNNEMPFPYKASLVLLSIITAGCAQNPNITSPDYKSTATFNEEDIAKDDFLSEGWLRKMTGKPSPSVAMLGAQYHFAHEFCKASISTADREKVDNFHQYAAITGLKIKFYTDRYPEFLRWVQEYAANYKAAMARSSKEVGEKFCERYVTNAIEEYAETPPTFASMDGPGHYRSLVFTLYFSRPDEKALQSTYRRQKVGNIITSIANPALNIRFGKKDKVDIHDMRTQYFLVDKKCDMYEPFLLHDAAKDHPVWSEYNSIQSCT